jgi:hypothetical protein
VTLMPRPANQPISLRASWVGNSQAHNHVKNQQCRVHALLLFAFSTGSESRSDLDRY